MHAAYIRPGGVAKDFPYDLDYDMRRFSIDFKKRINEIEYMLNKNRIWKERLKGVGVVNYSDALS
jgi:NADH:ubiquinone oxidoreductase subunit D